MEDSRPARPSDRRLRRFAAPCVAIIGSVAFAPGPSAHASASPVGDIVPIVLPLYASTDPDCYLQINAASDMATSGVGSFTATEHAAMNVQTYACQGATGTSTLEIVDSSPGQPMYSKRQSWSNYEGVVRLDQFVAYSLSGRHTGTVEFTFRVASPRLATPMCITDVWTVSAVGTATFNASRACS